jgi:iron complex transport system ATP-binding protein
VTTPGSAPGLRTRDLAVGYRSRRTSCTVLEGINVAVGIGELTCLLGPNGIGKSTLLRTLAAMQHALAGCVEVEGLDIRTLTPAERARRIGVVLTDRAPADGLTSRRVVELGRYPHVGWFGLLSPVDCDAVDAAIDAAGIPHLAARDIGRLSDGERQRVMIARALAQQPLLLILDEPTAFLDVVSRMDLMALLRDLARRERVAVIVSTHDLELALRVADVVWLALPGGTLVSGAPEDVMLSGAIGAAFGGRRIRFDVPDRAFRPLTGERGGAVVRGAGDRAALAMAVLEREGYSVAPIGSRVDLEVSVDDGGWKAVGAGEHESGPDFASLARCLRGRTPCR